MSKNVVRVYISHVMVLAGHTAVMHNSYVACHTEVNPAAGRCEHFGSA